MASDLLTITDVSRRSGVASSALRFYETKGLIASERAGSGHRRYPRAVLRRVAFIVFAQKIGLSLTEVAAELAALPRNRVPERADWIKEELAAARHAEVELARRAQDARTEGERAALAQQRLEARKRSQWIKEESELIRQSTPGSPAEGDE